MDHCKCGDKRILFNQLCNHMWLGVGVQVLHKLHSLVADICTWQPFVDRMPPFEQISKVSSSLITVLKTDSTPKEPLPCIKTVVYSFFRYLASSAIFFLSIVSSLCILDPRYNDRSTSAFSLFQKSLLYPGINNLYMRFPFISFFIDIHKEQDSALANIQYK